MCAPASVCVYAVVSAVRRVIDREYYELLFSIDYPLVKGYILVLERRERAIQVQEQWIGCSIYQMTTLGDGSPLVTFTQVQKCQNSWSGMKRAPSDRK